MQTKFKYLVLLAGLLTFRIIIGTVGTELYRNHTQPSDHIVINSIMKCGSTYVTTALQNNLNYERFRIPKSQDYKLLSLKEFFEQKRRILKLHVFPQAIDWDEYALYSDKIIIQVRDPRQALLSWVYHMKMYLKPDDNFVPDYFHQYTLSQQIDWVIEHQLPQMISFINAWIAFKEQQEKSAVGIKVLFSTYDELLNDETALFNKILTFYEIPSTMIDYRPVAKDENVLYRKGDPDEWRYVFSTEQKEKIARMIPARLMEKFNWQL